MAARLLAIASCGEDGAVKLWRVSVPPHGVQGDGVLAGRPGSEAPSGAELITTLRGHAGKHVWCLAASRADAAARVLASGGADGAIKLWPLPATREPRSGARVRGGDGAEAAPKALEVEIELSSLAYSALGPTAGADESELAEAPIRALQARLCAPPLTSAAHLRPPLPRCAGAQPATGDRRNGWRLRVVASTARRARCSRAERWTATSAGPSASKRPSGPTPERRGGQPCRGATARPSPARGRRLRPRRSIARRQRRCVGLRRA